MSRNKRPKRTQAPVETETNFCDALTLAGGYVGSAAVGATAGGMCAYLGFAINMAGGGPHAFVITLPWWALNLASGVIYDVLLGDGQGIDLMHSAIVATPIVASSAGALIGMGMFACTRAAQKHDNGLHYHHDMRP